MTAPRTPVCAPVKYQPPEQGGGSRWFFTRDSNQTSPCSSKRSRSGDPFKLSSKRPRTDALSRQVTVTPIRPGGNLSSTKPSPRTPPLKSCELLPTPPATGSRSESRSSAWYSKRSSKGLAAWHVGASSSDGVLALRTETHTSVSTSLDARSALPEPLTTCLSRGNRVPWPPRPIDDIDWSSSEGESITYVFRGRKLAVSSDSQQASRSARHRVGSLALAPIPRPRFVPKIPAPMISGLPCDACAVDSNPFCGRCNPSSRTIGSLQHVDPSHGAGAVLADCRDLR